MFGIKPEIKVTVFPRKETKTETAPEAPIIDWAAAEEAATRIGKKLITGVLVVSVSTIAAATLGAIAVTTVNHSLNK